MELGCWVWTGSCHAGEAFEGLLMAELSRLESQGKASAKLLEVVVVVALLAFWAGSSIRALIGGSETWLPPVGLFGAV